MEVVGEIITTIPIPFFIFINYEDVDVYEKVLMATRRQIGAGKALKDEDPMCSVYYPALFDISDN